jgi:DNA polymerase epsilon subunit 1
VYKIQELENVMSDSAYLPSDKYQRIYLGHSHNKNRHFWGLFIQATKEILFFVVNPANVNKAQGVQNLESIYANTIQELEMKETYADWTVVAQHHLKDLSQALKLIEQKLVEVKSRNKQATVCIVHSDITPQELAAKGLQSLANDFPVIRCPVVQSDNDYSALQWIPTACKNLTIRFTDVEEWMENQICMSRYSSIPVCNLGDNIQIIDTLYSRKLHISKHMLWYSDTSLPDLGGNEDRNCRIYF